MTHIYCSKRQTAWSWRWGTTAPRSQTARPLNMKALWFETSVIYLPLTASQCTIL